MKKLRSNATDMTSGSPYRLLFLFTAPLLLGNVFQQLYNMVDSIVVGNFIGDCLSAICFQKSTCEFSHVEDIGIRLLQFIKMRISDA